MPSATFPITGHSRSEREMRSPRTHPLCDAMLAFQFLMTTLPSRKWGDGGRGDINILKSFERLLWLTSAELFLSKMSVPNLHRKMYWGFEKGAYLGDVDNKSVRNVWV